MAGSVITFRGTEFSISVYDEDSFPLDACEDAWELHGNLADPDDLRKLADKIEEAEREGYVVALEID